MMRLSTVLVAVFLVLVQPVWGWSQIGSGQVRGVCRDPEGASIPQVEVLIKNVETGYERAVVTDAAGRFSAPFMPVGTYVFRARSPRMAPLERSGLLLTVGATVEVVLDMSPSTTSDATLVGEAPMVQASQTEVSSILNGVALHNLPVNGRRWENFVLLTPNVTNDGDTGLVSFHGTPGVFNNTMVDGADNNQAFFGEERGRRAIPYPISQDTIREFEVNTSNFSAEYGRAAGGTVNAVTRSGTNAFHGSAFYYLRDRRFLAQDPFARADGQAKPPERRHQFGGFVGGPISKDKLFMFLSYDQQSRNFPVTVLPVGGESFYTGSVAPPAATTATVNFLRSLTGVFPREANQNLVYGKLDWQVNNRNLLVSSWNILNFRSPNGVETAAVANVPVSSNGDDGVKNETSITSLTSVLSPSAVNEFRFQYSRDFEFQKAHAPGPWVTISNAGGAFQYGMPDFLPRAAYPNERRLQFMDNLSMMRGRHDFKIGADINVVRDLLITIPGAGGAYAYASLTDFAEDFSAAPGAARRRYSQFTQTFDSTDPQGRVQFHTVDWNFYFQDHYVLSPKLTMNLGVRYEYQQLPRPKESNPSLPQTALLHEDKSNIGPRLGVAWQPVRGTVLRVGYGLTFARMQNSTISSFLVGNGTRQWIFQAFPATTGAPNFPDVFAAPPSGVVPVVVRMASPDFVNPEVHQATVEAQHQISEDWSVAARYLMARGTHLPYTRDTNIVPAATQRTYTVLSASGTTDGTITVPFYNTRSKTAFGPLMTYETGASSWYHALTLDAKKRFNREFQLMTSFTWSHATDDGQSTYNFVPGDTVLDPFNRRADYANSALDQRKRFVFSGVWQPEVNPDNWSAGYLLTDWKVAGTVILADGFPQTGVVELATLPGSLGGGLNGSGNTNNRFPGIGRNAFVRPGLANVDLRVARTFPVRETTNVEMLVEGFNIFNRVNYAAVNATQYLLQGTKLVPNPLFMKPQRARSFPAAGGPRQLQLSVRYNF